MNQTQEVLVNDSVDTKQCSICNKHIETAKLRLHEATCARNNYKCSKCQDVVAKSEKEQHEKEAHTQVQCKYCKYEAEPKNVMVHQGVCTNKPIPCQYCENEYGVDHFYEHQEACGAKTRTCPDCKRNVLMKNMNSHPCHMYQQENARQLEEELKQFQEKENLKIVSDGMSKQRKEEDKRKQERFMQNATGMNTLQQQNTNAKVVNVKQDSPDKLGTNDNEDEATQALIRQMMNEDSEFLEAQKIQEQLNNPQANNRRSNDVMGEGGVRAPIQSFEDQLIGGGSSYYGSDMSPDQQRGPASGLRVQGQPIVQSFQRSGPYGTFVQQTRSFPGMGGGVQTSSYTYSTSYNQPQVNRMPQQQTYQEQNYQVDNNHHDFEQFEENSFMQNEDAELQKALLASTQGVNANANVNNSSANDDFIDPYEEQLKQVLEQSKQQK